MANFKSDIVDIKSDIHTVFSKLSNPETLQSVADKLPPEAKQKIENISFSQNAISVKANPVGELKLEITERKDPELIVFSAVSSPLPFKVVINLEDNGGNATKACADIDVELNPFIKPMVQGPLTEAAKKFGELLSIIPYDSI
jgi:hypothetical protein